MNQGQPGLPETLAQFARFISRHMALHFAEDRLAELEQKLAPLAREAGQADLAEFLKGVMSAPPSRSQLKPLARALTIGETYFLRDPRSYQVLEREVLPELIARKRQGDRTLRLWSAGCASGEEPYTLAILLSRVIPDLGSWQISLVGTDINEQSLEKARQGNYSKWSFRNAPAWLMDYFTRQEDGRYQIVPRIRDMVRFEYLNLAQPQAEAEPVTGTDVLDIIFCRNVMLYFGPAQIERTMGRFHRALNEGGYLFVGPTEVDQRQMEGFSCRRLEGAFVLSKESRVPQPPPPAAAPPLRVAAPPLPRQRHREPAKVASPAPKKGAPAPAAPPAFEQALSHYRTGSYQLAADLVRQLRDAGPADLETLMLGARALANISRFGEAGVLCDEALAADPLSVPAHYLKAIILEHLGEPEAACAALKRVLFIDGEFLLAYFALGNLYRVSGDAAESQRNYANALRLLERRDPQELLPDTEGLSAGALAQLIRDMTPARRRDGVR
ncbi:protein-glutamate O-methyltransferase [Geomonas silvestris]|uniref:Protein-glutamate O-methyltransferase n=1 Tax=Geomonas silvestris TaxID=2740184 RepID=A0A6V8MNE9_9BACT|nr:protein-glutamate O-methyltransferase CheR [Geomonas silvestris]GFO61502.1 protein-glutamate O-methyltransferase [Geomonas silvestris]